MRDIRRKVLHRRFRPQIPALEIELHFDGRQSRFLAYEMDGHREGHRYTEASRDRLTA